MSKHTPGPWECGKGYGMHGVEIVGDSGNRMVCGVIGVDRDQYEKDGRKAAEVQTPDGWANAHLISAAPELLAALEKAVFSYGKPGGPWSVPSEPGAWIAQARAAIAKATGATP